MKLCGKCLHDRNCHTDINGHLKYCGACQKPCDVEDFNTDYKPSSIETVMRIGASRQ